jgi:Uncharacterised protein family (UPF0160)
VCSDWMHKHGGRNAALRMAITPNTATRGAGAIMKLDQACPWKSQLYDLEEEQGKEGQVKFALFKDDREGKWRVQVRTPFDGRVCCGLSCARAPVGSRAQAWAVHVCAASPARQQRASAALAEPKNGV